MKKCSKCRETKPKTDFHAHAGKKDGLRSHCKQCGTKAFRERWHRNLDASRAKARENNHKWHAANGEKHRAAVRAKLDSNPALRALKNQRNREWLAKNPGASVRHRLKTKYGLSPADVDAMRAKQQGRCAICTQEVPLFIDHNHATGKVRGLLCNVCNTGLGKFRESPALLHAAIAYLEQHDLGADAVPLNDCEERSPRDPEVPRVAQTAYPSLGHR